jgi:predicted dehydrogenase
VQVTAYGSLEHYGKNGKFRGASCRSCPHKKECKFYWDINADETLKRMYVDNEKHDGYIRDGCVFSEKIDIYDKMSAQVIYANGVTLNYSLTTYSPYEGHRLSFNGFDGRLDTWQDIPYQRGDLAKIDQAQRHALEMSQFANEEAEGYEEIIVHENFKTEFESIKVPKYKGGHGGGDIRMHTKMFRGEPKVDPLNTNAGTRDGAMSILIGIAARKSIDEKRTVKISELTDIVPMSKRPV